MFSWIGAIIGVLLSVLLVAAWWQQGGRMYVWALLVFPGAGILIGGWVDNQIDKLRKKK